MYPAAASNDWMGSFPLQPSTGDLVWKSLDLPRCEHKLLKHSASCCTK
jgi:hypothetical protein